MNSIEGPPMNGEAASWGIRVTACSPLASKETEVANFVQ